MEIYESCDDECVGETRYLFEGRIYEILNQNREFEEPSRIDWPIGQVVVPEDKIELARCANEEGFYEWLGTTLRDIFRDDSEPDHSLGQFVTSAYLGGSCEDVFTALVGWSIPDLLERWKEFKDWQNEDAVVAEGAKKLLEEGLF